MDTDNTGHAGLGPTRADDWVAAPVSTAEIETFVARLAVDSPAHTDADRVDRIGALEAVKAAAAAAQARDIVAFAESQLEDQAARGLRAKDRGTGIAAQVALACRQSPHRGGRMVATARALVTDLPRTFAALSRGQTSEFRASLVAKETAILDAEQRRRVDAELGPRLHELGDRRVEAEARGWACRLAPEAVVERASKAHEDRRVTIRPAPDTMTYLTGLLSVREGVAVYAALDAAAKAAAGVGDPRSRGQVMADTLVERVTGVSSCAQPVEISVIMTDRALFDGGDEPAEVLGYGPVPAQLARRWILSLLDVGDDAADIEEGDDLGRHRRSNTYERGRLWLRRLYATPTGDQLVAMDSHRRSFPRLLRRLIEFRDRMCATPYCGAPIRHIDHIEPARRAGATSYANGRGTCARCNHAKEAPGWSASVTESAPVVADAGEGHHPPVPQRCVTLTTPTGHAYASRPPPVHHDAGFSGPGPSSEPIGGGIDGRPQDARAG